MWKRLQGKYKKKSNQPKMSRPPCSTSADPLLKTSGVKHKVKLRKIYDIHHILLMIMQIELQCRRRYQLTGQWEFNGTFSALIQPVTSNDLCNDGVSLSQMKPR